VEEAPHGLAPIDGNLAAVEFLIDLGRPAGHLHNLLLALVLGWGGSAVLVIDVAGVDPPLPGKHVEQEAGEEPEPGGCRKEV